MKKVEVIRGPGFERMRARLGEEGMEALRLDTLRIQTSTREFISARDRETYQDYPPPKRKKK